MTSQIIIYCWFSLLLISLIGIFRIIYELRAIPAEYVIDEKLNWNSKLNPFKTKVYFIFACVFTLPIFTHKYFISITNQIEAIIILCVTIIYIIGTHYFLGFKIKSHSKGFSQDLAPTKLKSKEILEKYNFATDNGFFKCDLGDFEAALKFSKIEKRILWEKKIVEKNKDAKDRQLLLSFLNDCLNKQIFEYNVADKIKCEYINKYFEFNEFKDGLESTLKPYTISDFRSNKKYS